MKTNWPIYTVEYTQKKKTTMSSSMDVLRDYHTEV